MLGIFCILNLYPFFEKNNLFLSFTQWQIQYKIWQKWKQHRLCAWDSNFFFNGSTPASFCLFKFFSTTNCSKKLPSAGFELGSSEYKASTLTTWPLPLPKKHIFVVVVLRTLRSRSDVKWFRSDCSDYFVILLVGGTPLIISRQASERSILHNFSLDLLHSDNWVKVSLNLKDLLNWIKRTEWASLLQF